MNGKQLDKRESMDKRFALVDNSGELRYPYKKRQRNTGKYGFVVGNDRHQQGEYLNTLEEVITAVVFGGKRVRVSVDPPTLAKGSSGLSLHAMREVKGYVISDELRPLVANAPISPLGEPSQFQRKGKHLSSDVPAVYMVITQEELLRLCTEEAPLFLNRRSNWTTVAEWQAARPDSRERTHVLMQIAGDVAGATWAAQIDSVKCNPGPTAFVEISELGSLPSAVGRSRVTEFQTGKPLDDTVLRSDIPCVVNASVIRAIRERVIVLPGDAELAAAAKGAEAEVSSDPQCADLPETVRRALVNARVGQGGYRKRMIAIWGGRCAVTECSLDKVLVASHAKAWKLSSNKERLDPFNGLLLSAHVDRLFDAGLISFDDAGTMLVSPSLHRDDLVRLGIDAATGLKRVDPRHIPYLKAHRIENGFKP